MASPTKRTSALILWAVLATALAMYFGLAARAARGSSKDAALGPVGDLVAAVLSPLFAAFPKLPWRRRPAKRNFIFMVSDGMGPASLSMARSFHQYVAGLDTTWTLSLDAAFIGNSRTRSYDSLVTDSAAGATAFSCGIKTYNGAVGVHPDGKSCGTVLEAAKLAGYTTGMVVTTRITDATPASFAAHVDWRAEEDVIAEQLLGWNHPLGQYPADLLIGGGRCHFAPRRHDGCRGDKLDLIANATAEGWTYVENRAGFDTLQGGRNVTLPLLALLAPGDIPYDIDRLDERHPSLAETVETALVALEAATADSEHGFFLLVEGSRIDHAGHQNDPGAQVREVLAYDAAWRAVTAFADRAQAETVIVSTSDHETGGLSTARQVTAGYPDYLWLPEVLGNATHSTEYLASRLRRFTPRKSGAAGDHEIEHFVRTEVLGAGGLNLPEVHDRHVALVVKYRHNAQDVLAHLLSVAAQIGWATHGHSAVDVNVYGYARDAARLDAVRGGNENTVFAGFMADYLRVDLESVNWATTA